MDALRQWTFGICAATLTAGIAVMLVPDGAAKKIFKTVTSVFVLCCLLSPFLKWCGNIAIDSDSLFEQAYADNTQALQTAVNRQVLTACERKISELTKENLSAAGIKTDSVTVNMDIGTDNSIIINELVVKLANAQDEAAAVKTLKQQMGLDCRIEKAENGGRSSE